MVKYTGGVKQTRFFSRKYESTVAFVEEAKQIWPSVTVFGEDCMISILFFIFCMSNVWLTGLMTVYLCLYRTIDYWTLCPEPRAQRR